MLRRHKCYSCSRCPALHLPPNSFTCSCSARSSALVRTLSARPCFGRLMLLLLLNLGVPLVNGVARGPWPEVLRERSTRGRDVSCSIVLIPSASACCNAHRARAQKLMGP